MTKINLRDYYPHYTQDCFIDVPDEVASLLMELKLAEAAYRLRTYRNKAYYSLDRGDGIECDILLVVLSPHEIYERKIAKRQLYAAISNLPDKQAKRIYAHFFMGMSKAEIARAEGISEQGVSSTINRAIHNLEKFMEKLL